MKRNSRRAGLLMLLLGFMALDLGSGTERNVRQLGTAFASRYSQTDLSSLVQQYDSYLRNAVDSQYVPGASVAIVYQGEIRLLRGYGVVDISGNQPVDIHTAFRLGSVSKGFASVLTGLLVEEGQLDWNDRLKKYLTDFTLRDTAIASQLTIKHILSHTSGFPEHTFTDLLDNGYSYNQARNALVSVPVMARPGEVYSYQNVIYSLIGDVLYAVSGKEYPVLMDEKIFRPLDMTEASTDFASFATNPNTASPHIRKGSAWKAIQKNDRYYSASPASGINASASDMAKWLLALTGYYPQVIPSSTIKDISQAVIETPKKSSYRRNWKSLEKTYYGLGWRVFNAYGQKVIYHGGFVQGFRAEIAFLPEEGIGIAVMFNANSSLASQCIPQFIDQLSQLPVQSPEMPTLANNE